MKEVVEDMKKSDKWRPKDEPNGYSSMRHNCQNLTSFAVKIYSVGEENENGDVVCLIVVGF